MGRRKLSSELAVWMNGVRVGILKRLSTGRLEFSYEEAWMKDEQSGRPLSLSMPLRRESYFGEVVENFFDNLLPDNLAIRQRLQRQFQAPSDRSFELLTHIGKDCVGAVQLCPAEMDPPNVRTCQASPVSEQEVARILKSYRSMPLGISSDDDFRISLAGAQEKTALLRWKGTWHRPHGSTPTSHILKLPIGQIDPLGLDLSDSVENEWLCHQIVKEYGLPVADVGMENFEEVKVLVVERFDRRWSEDGSWIMRLPQEDMCQALNVPPALKYESDGGPGIQKIMTLLLGSSRSFEDRKQFLFANVLFWILAAIDGHAKNFSIFLQPGGSYCLTPMYDILSAHPYLADRSLEERKIKMAMAVLGKNRHYHWHTIQKRHFASTATACHFPAEEMHAIVDELFGRMDEVIAAVGNSLPPQFPDTVADLIFQGMLHTRDRFTWKDQEG
jgi:serine/threonine-protein kinase HipA